MYFTFITTVDTKYTKTESKLYSNFTIINGRNVICVWVVINMLQPINRSILAACILFSDFYTPDAATHGSTGATGSNILNTMEHGACTNKFAQP